MNKNTNNEVPFTEPKENKKLTFAAYLNWMFDHRRKKGMTEYKLYLKIFAYYLNVKTDSINATRVSHQKAGREYPTKEMVEMYRNESKAIGDLENQIATVLIPELLDLGKAIDSLLSLIENDDTVSPDQKEKLKSGCLRDGGMGTAKWMTKVLQFAMGAKDVPAMPDAQQILNIDRLPSPCTWFVGRTNETKDIHKFLKKDRRVWLCGIPGIGKSELAKRYLQKNKGDYAQILWIPCQTNLRKSITMVEMQQDDLNDSEEKRFLKHLRAIKEIPEKGLVILDNCNWSPAEDPLLGEILQVKCHILVTSRVVADDWMCLEIGELSITDLLELTKKFYKMDNFPKKDMIRLIRRLHCHTFAVELAARMTAKNCPSPRELCRALLKERFVRTLFRKPLHYNKDNRYGKGSYYEIMRDLFALLKLNEDSQEVLRNMSLIPQWGAAQDNLRMLMDLPDDTLLEALQEIGLLHWDEDNGVAYMPPMVREITLTDLTPSIQACSTMISKIADLFGNYGADYPYFALLYAVVDQIILEAEKNHAVLYWLLLCNAFNYMEQVGDKIAMRRLLAEMERYMDEERLGWHEYAELLDMQASMEEDGSRKAELGERALALLEENGEADCQLAWNIRNNLGGAYRMMGDYGKAIACLESRLKEIVWGKDERSRDTYLACMCTLSMAYAEWGQCQKALDTMIAIQKDMQKAIQKNQEAEGYEYAMVLEVLGSIHIQSGNLLLGRQCYQKALMIFADLYGRESPQVQSKRREYTTMLRVAGNKPKLTP